jgi:hypothetical protein
LLSNVIFRAPFGTLVGKTENHVFWSRTPCSAFHSHLE